MFLNRIHNFKLSNLKLGIKLNILFSIIIIISLFILSYVSFTVISNTLIEQAITSTEQILIGTGEKVNITFEEIDKLSTIFKSNTTLGESIYNYHNFTLTEQIYADNTIQILISDYFAFREEIADVFFITTHKDYTNSKSYLGISPGYDFKKDNPELINFKNSNSSSYWTKTYISNHERTRVLSEYVITLFRDITNLSISHKSFGTLIINVRESALRNLIKDTELGYNSSNLFIVNESGIVIEDINNPNSIGKSITSEKYYSELSESSSKLYTKLKILISGKEYLLVSSKIESTNWNLIGIVPMKSITKGINDTFTIILIISIVILLIGLLISRIITQDILKGVNNIVKNINLIKNGTLKTPSIDTREDELGTISYNFIEMVEKINMLNKLKDDFLSNTSHELRTPIDGIIGISESILSGATGKLTLETEENLKMILSSGKRLSSLINDILDFSKLKNKDILLRKQRVDIKQLANIVFTIIKSTSPKKELEFINNISDECCQVFGDENRIQQILYNLLGNAFKYTNKGFIYIYSKKNNNFIEICVEDTGIGIHKNDLVSIFASYEQIDTTSNSNIKGTGLGLSITKKLIELHNGKIWVESSPTKGSRFYFTLEEFSNVLPQKKSTSLNDVVKLSDLPLHEETIYNENFSNNHNISNSEYTILIVDDEIVNLQVLKNYLGLNNYNTDTATNGLIALEKIKKNSYDLLLIDIMMPIMSGYELCNKTRELYTHFELPIIILTAKSQTKDIVAGFNVGANDYLTKPFEKSELLARVKTLISLKTAVNKTIYTESKLKIATELSEIDYLTGINNRRNFIKLSKNSFIEQINANKCLSILMIDVDNFKNINDKFGHIFGDKVLQFVAKSIHDSIRKNDILGRYGGEEFCVLLYDITKENVLEISEKIRKSIEEINIHTETNNHVSCTVSIGISIYGGKETFEELLNTADTMLYKAKNSGKNKCYLS